MLVKDWLSVVIPASNIKVIDGNISAYGTKESLEENYGDFDLKRVEQVDDTDLLILYVSTKCPHYKTRTVKHYLSEYERGYYAALYGGTQYECIDEEESYCFGTKNCEVCHCGGDKRKCDFYPAK
jgi:hypothetical protein